MNKIEDEYYYSSLTGSFFAIQVFNNLNTSNFILIEDNVFYEILRETRGLTEEQFDKQFTKIKKNEMNFKFKDSIEYQLLYPFLINPNLCTHDSLATNIMDSLRYKEEIMCFIDNECTLFTLCRNNMEVWQDDYTGSFGIRKKKR